MHDDSKYQKAIKYKNFVDKKKDNELKGTK